MHYEEMLSWLLFYNSLLDVTKTPQLDVIDPGGIVRSQVVQTADGTLRIALNASQSPQTLSSRFITHYFGSGVQHIALATDDIVATVKQLRANGVALLSMPENYYDDLEARTDLSAERIDVLRSNHILYDRDEAGEYLQAYTRSFEDLFFFEIVERRPQRLRRGERINSPGRPDAEIRSGALGYFSPDSSFTTRAFCAGVTSLTTPTTFLWVLAGSRYSTIRSIFTLSAMSCGLSSVSFIAACR